MTIHYLGLILALICAVIAALDVTTHTIRLIASALAFFFLSLLVTGCAGGLHGNVHTGVTGSVTDPTNAQYNVGAQFDFAKRPHAKSAKDAKDY